MTNRIFILAPSVVALLLGSSVAATVAAKPVPTPLARVGACAFTTVRQVTQRLEGGKTHTPVAGSGSSIQLANGVYGVSYDEVEAVNRSKPGDPVMTCLAKVPRHCPPGDKRGRLYTTTNLRTDESWTLPDAEHQCGGA